MAYRIAFRPGGEPLSWRAGKTECGSLGGTIKYYIECYEKFGFGFCAMVLKETGEWIGTGGLQPLEDTGEIEVGYNFSERFWRHGFGEEAARAWLEYGFGSAGLERIVAVAHPHNTGSWRIMENCGMTFKGRERHWGIECVVYAISKLEYKKTISLIAKNEHPKLIVAGLFCIYFLWIAYDPIRGFLKTSICRSTKRGI